MADRPRGLRRATVVLAGVAVFVLFRVASKNPPPPPFTQALPDASPVEMAGLRLPSGEQPRLSCEQARGVVEQARSAIFREPAQLDEGRFATMAIDWLDPHGFWSAADRAPIAPHIHRRKSALLKELQAKSGPCAASAEVAGEIFSWMEKLRAAYRAGGEIAPLTEALTQSAFDERQLEVDPLETARMLGARARALRAAFGSSAAGWVEKGEERLFPSFDAIRWQETLLAAEVRAYVAALDPHGAWAPLDEESSVYDLNLTERPPSLLWETSVRTSFGLLVDGGAKAPLRDGDVVFAMGDVALAGLSVEESDQLAAAFAEAERPIALTLVRDGKLEHLAALPPEWKGDTARPKLDVETIEYGDGKAAILHIRDVRDSLGEEVSNSIEVLPPSLRGLILDLRGNSGGSTDGAAHALGAFLPQAPLFPMLHRDHSIEVQAAAESEHVYNGPLAVLVDHDTASAAEMIAGALLAYRRAQVVGEPTFGKGCAQEYIDDATSVGVLRITTLVFALPDGAAMQQKGLAPTIAFPFSKSGPTEAERLLPNAPPTWSGPDVRDPSLRAAFEQENIRAWPANGGHVSGCEDSAACRAIQLLGRGRSVAKTSAPSMRR